ncbi:hypothetical protein EJ110_NYTH51967 [Nymphaea thermarum]|nr:hypothetical protein EJ110_NYTH51967 [Nymphaea thermarum]
MGYVMFTKKQLYMLIQKRNNSIYGKDGQTMVLIIVRTIIFSCALLVDEKRETFKWLFEEWLHCMGNKALMPFFTVQELKMKVAVKVVIPNTDQPTLASTAKIVTLKSYGICGFSIKEQLNNLKINGIK